MDGHLMLKGKEIGVGKPLICVPVMENNIEDIIAEVKRLAGMGVDVIEWRVDAFRQVSEPAAVKSVLESIKPILKESLFLFTYRSKSQGGLGELATEEVEKLQLLAVQSPDVDMIDVEFFDNKRAAAWISQIHAYAKTGVLSHHDFNKTPDTQVMYDMLLQMKNAGGDIVKLAVMPEVTEDVLRLLEVTNRFHKNYPAHPLITMSMGNLGVISRVSGELFGSCLTFGAGKQSSAPGQISYDILKQFLEELHL